MTALRRVMSTPRRHSPERMGRFFAVTFAGLVLLFLTQASSFAAPTDSRPSTTYRTDQILVAPAPGGNSSRLAQFHVQQRSRVLQTLPFAEGLQVISVPEGETVAGLVATYQRSGLVRFAEPDYLRYLDLTTPNDPQFVDGTLWALNNYGQNGGTIHADIEAPLAWDVLTSASNVVVAVLDTGIRYTHEDLAANMWVNPADGGHGTNSFAGTSDPNDDEGHGTLLAGVIGAVGNNGKGVVGVAWKTQLMACKCFNSAGASSDSAIVAAIDYARLNGANIVNASFDSTNFGIALSNAVERARSAGILFIASCGNNSVDVDTTPHYPACFDIDNVVSVAYTTRSDGLGRYSNFGASKVALAAPGAGIYSCFFASDNSYLGSPALEGTSYAAAYVSGALALVLAKYPGESHQKSIARVLAGTDPLPALAGKCVTGGRLNLFKTLAPPIQLSSLPSPIPGVLRFRANSSPARSCAIHDSTDLIHWRTESTNITSMAGVFEFTELTLTNSARFYRAVGLP